MRRALFIAVAACASKPPASVTPDNTATQGAAPGPATACPGATPQTAQRVADLDVEPDLLHSDYTPAVHALIGEGLPGACAVVELLVAAEPDTRLHAARVLEGVLLAEHGWRAGRGFPHEYAEEQSVAAVKAIWYDADAEPADLRAGAARWRAWVDGPHPGTTAPPDGPGIDEMTAALDATLPALEQCGQPVDLTVTFDRTGAVSAISGTASTEARYRGCLTAATTAVHVRPFHRAEVWIRYPWH